MPDRIYINQQEGVIEVISYEPLTRQDMENTNARLQELYAELSLYKVLFDTTRLTTVPPVSDLLEVCPDFPSYLKMAVVLKPGGETHAPLFFAEKVGQKSGLDVRNLYSKAEALQWLHEEVVEAVG